MGTGRPPAGAGPVQSYPLNPLRRRYDHRMVSAEIRNRGDDAIFDRIQPHTAQHDQTTATLDGFLIEDTGEVFFGKGNRGAGGGWGPRSLVGR